MLKPANEAMDFNFNFFSEKNAKRGFSSARNVRDFAKIAKRKSIMTMSQPGVYEYPLLVSSAIDVDALMLLVKGYQITYASSVATAFSLNPIMDPDKYEEVSDFVQSFHTNNASILNANLNAAAKTLGIESWNDIPLDDIVVESGMISKNLSQEEIAAINSSAWDNVSESMDMSSLNDIYKPYARTERILKEKLGTVKAANEAIGDIVDKVNDFASDVNRTVDRYQNSNMAGSNPIYSQSSKVVKRDIVDSKTGKILGASKDVTTDRKSIDRINENKVVKERELAAMEPTMVNVNILIRGQNTAPSRNLTLGVKAMPRLISSNLMIASMVEACRDSHGIFKFLKWTKGEVKTLDFVLGISASKQKALEKNAKQEVKLLEQCKKRKRLNGVGKFLSNNVLPTATIVITSYEASKIKESCGVDLNNLREALNLMQKYYLLSFGIYDVDQGTFKVLFDCDRDWGYTVVQSMKSAISKTNDVLNQNEVLKVFGRR